MQRCTFLKSGIWTLVDRHGEMIQGEWVDRLAQYENTGYQPNEVQSLIAMLNSATVPSETDKPWREVLRLSTRANNGLRRNSLTENLSVAQLAQLKSWDIAKLRNIGEVSRQQIAEELQRVGFSGTDWALKDYY